MFDMLICLVVHCVHYELEFHTLKFWFLYAYCIIIIIIIISSSSSSTLCLCLNNDMPDYTAQLMGQPTVTQYVHRPVPGGGGGGFGGSDDPPPTGLHGPHFLNACMQRKMRDDAETRRCMIAKYIVRKYIYFRVQRSKIVRNIHSARRSTCHFYKNPKFKKSQNIIRTSLHCSRVGTSAYQ